MAKLDGVSKELYPGEAAAAMKRKYYPDHSDAWARLDRMKAKPEDDFRFVDTRFVERRVASGHKVVYKNLGVFRG